MVRSEQWSKIMANLKDSLDEKSLKRCISIASVGTTIRAFDDEVNWLLFDQCIKKPHELKDLSMVDLEYLSRVLSTTNYHDKTEMIENVGTVILNELLCRLNSVALKSTFQNFISIVRNLAIINVYNLELMDNILSPEYLHCMYKKMKKIDLQMYEIDGYCRINLKDTYKGNLLDEAYLKKVCYLITWIPDRVNNYRKIDEFTYNIEDVVKKLFTHSQYAHAVPYRKFAGKIEFLCKISSFVQFSFFFIFF